MSTAIVWAGKIHKTLKEQTFNEPANAPNHTHAAIVLCPSVALAEGGVAAGKAVFKECAACHFVNKE